MPLKNTVDLMLSDNYKDRFRAEYYQTKERYQRLHLMIIKYEAGTLDFQPMGEYLYVLEMRAQLEEIDLK